MFTKMLQGLQQETLVYTCLCLITRYLMYLLTEQSTMATGQRRETVNMHLGARKSIEISILVYVVLQQQKAILSWNLEGIFMVS